MLSRGAGRIYQSQRQHATLLELYKRGLESDAVSIGILVNERSFLDKQYMQESLPQSLDRMLSELVLASVFFFSLFETDHCIWLEILTHDALTIHHLFVLTSI
jgi:hypothetical protein